MVEDNTYAFQFIRLDEVIINPKEMLNRLETSYSVHIVLIGGGGGFIGRSLQIGEGPFIVKKCLHQRMKSQSSPS